MIHNLNDVVIYENQPHKVTGTRWHPEQPAPGEPQKVYLLTNLITNEETYAYEGEVVCVHRLNERINS